MASEPFVRPSPERLSWYIAPSDITDRSANPIGRGGLDSVFTGTYLGSKVAIKQLLDTCSTHQLNEYHHDIDLWQKLSHPNVLSLLGACDRDDDGNPIPPFMVSPFMPNGTLRDHVSDPATPVSLGEKLRLLRQVAAGMVYLHEHNVAHGDLKAANVLLDGGVNAVISDFGLSRIKHTSVSIDSHAAKSQTDGSLDNRTPKTLADERPAESSRAADIHAFGILMYEVLNDGKPVWATGDAQARHV
ncbi:kinase-like domain-containing protein, partial [Polychytrium aggregatum]|uniref:kinase-like domain-containing protein n=1 Tax=Polychytrium aggregatum TaxID=110093 RepID=UPI0022FEF433